MSNVFNHQKYFNTLVNISVVPVIQMATVGVQPKDVT